MQKQRVAVSEILLPSGIRLRDEVPGQVRDLTVVGELQGVSHTGTLSML